MLEWLLLLKDYKNNIEIAMNSTVAHININSFLIKLNKSSVLSDFPEESADLLVNLLNKANGNTYYWTLDEIVDKLRLKGVSERKISNLKELIN